MYSVFLVDDEHIVLDGIRNRIDWDNEGFSFAGEASDGELAYSMIQEVKPDILITDIKMPFMDGLTLARMVKKIQPWIRIIILSGHDEFDFAKEAITIGVDDYILKPFTHDQIVSSLNKTATNLDKIKKQAQDINRLKTELESNQVLVRNKFLSDLVLGNLDTASVVETSNSLAIPLTSRFYKVIISELHPQKDDSMILKTIQSRINSFISNFDDAICFFIAPERFVSILKSQNDKEIEDNSFSYAEAVEHLVIQNLDCTVISAIGKTVEHKVHITSSYFDADHVLVKTKYWNKSRILSSDDIREFNQSSLLLQENDPLVDKLKYANINEIDSIANQYLKMIGETDEQFSIIASYLFVDIIMAASKLAEDLGGNIKDIMPEVLSRSYIDNSVVSEDTFIAEVKKVLSIILKYRDSKLDNRYVEVILGAKEYINKNYASQDTSLKTVANHVHLSPNHFSTIFSQECQITFIEYLTNVRIDEAKKKLLNTTKKSADIAYECGFSDPHYFSYIFKKTTGLSPREYKNRFTK